MPRTATLPDGQKLVFDTDQKIWRYEDGRPLVGQGVSSDRVPEASRVAEIPRGEPAGFKTSFDVGVVDDPGTKIRLLSESTGIPESRFTIANDGKTLVYLDDEGEWRRAQGNSLLDKAGGVATALPETVGGIAGGVAGTATPVGPIGGGAIGVAGANALKNVYANTVLGEPQDPIDVAEEIALETGIDVAFGAAGGKVGKFVTRNAGKRAVPDIAQFDRKATLDTIKRIEDVTGIKLDVAQASGLASLKALRKWAFKYPNQASNILEANRLLQEGQSEAAVKRIMGALHEGLDNTKLASEGINAAQASIDFAIEQRRLATKPFYDMAFDGAEAVDVKPIVQFITSEIDSGVKGPRLTALRKARNLLMRSTGKSGGKTPETRLKALHSAKIALDDMLGNDPKTSAARSAHGALKEIRGNLIKTLEGASPVYKTAQERFAHISQTMVNPLTDGMIGELARVQGNKNAALIARWFSAGTGDPRQIGVLKRIIERQPNGREAWRGLLKTRMATALDRAATETQGGVTNIGAKFRQQLFGSPNQRATWRAALGGSDDQVMELFETTMEAFNLIQTAGTSGSDTAFNLAVENGLRAAAPWTGVKNLTGRPLESLARGIRDMIAQESEQAFVERNAIAIADAMVHPTKVHRLAQLSRTGMNAKTAAEVMGVVIGLQVAEELEE